MAGFTLGSTPSQAPKAPLPQVASTTSSGGSDGGESNGGAAGAEAEVSAANVAIAVEVKIPMLVAVFICHVHN